jgi:hypothetical protein
MSEELIQPSVGPVIRETNLHSQELPPVTLAFVLDEKVVDVLHTDERLAAIFLSQPTVVDITPADGIQTVFVNHLYDAATNTFTPAPVDSAE